MRLIQFLRPKLNSLLLAAVAAHVEPALHVVVLLAVLEVAAALQ
jgi:hypothetical protein